MIQLEFHVENCTLYVLRIFLVHHTRDLLNGNLFKTVEADVNSNKIKDIAHSVWCPKISLCNLSNHILILGYLLFLRSDKTPPSLKLTSRQQYLLLAGFPRIREICKQIFNTCIEKVTISLILKINTCVKIRT